MAGRAVRDFISATLHRVVLVVLLVGGCTWKEEVPGTGNRSPSVPVVAGPDTIAVGMPESFEVTVYDPDGDRLRVFVAWGDGDTNDYGDFVESGATVPFDHRFTDEGTFRVRARCHDLEPLFSDWSTPRDVVVLAGD